MYAFNSNATTTDNVLHGVTNAGNYRVPEMFDGITDVINQVPKTKAAMINSLALLGMDKSWLTERQEVDEDKYDMRKPKEVREYEEALEKMTQKRIKAFGAISRHILVPSKAYTVIGSEVFEAADPVLFWDRFIKGFEADSSAGLVQQAEVALRPHKEKQDLISFIHEKFKLWDSFSRFDGGSMAISEPVIIGLILNQARQVTEFKDFIQDFIMKEVITKDFGELEYVKVFDTLNMYLVAKEGSDGQPSTKTKAVFNASTDQSGKKQRKDQRPPKPGKAKRERFNNFNKRNAQQNTSKPGKERCAHCGDSRHDETNCWKKHPELRPNGNSQRSVLPDVSQTPQNAGFQPSVFESSPYNLMQNQGQWPMPGQSNRFMGYQAQIDQFPQRSNVPENGPRHLRFHNFHVRIHCELRGALLDAITDETIIDSGASACIVNVWYKASLLEFETITGDITGAGGISLGAITGVGKIKFLNKTVTAYYCENIPKSVISVSALTFDGIFEFSFRFAFCGIRVQNELKDSDLDEEGNQISQLEVDDFYSVRVSQEGLYPIPRKWIGFDLLNHDSISFMQLSNIGQ